jgi:hypothetical protein
MSLTSAQLVTRICPKGDDVATVTERVRRWTKLGLLIGSAPGRGGTQRYDHGTIIDAAVLNALAGVWGFSIRDQDRAVLRLACRYTRERATIWAAGIRRPHWLGFEWPRSGLNACYAIEHVDAIKPSAGIEATLILDVGNILTRVNWNEEDEAAATASPMRKHK